MPEAVIVSAARSPIGRANKGSLKDFRPDDLTAFIIRTALDKVPGLDPNTVDDLYLGCGLPGGESGNNMARVVNVLNGMDDVPGATHHPLLRLLGADHPDGVPRDQGRRGRRLRLGRRRDRLPVRQGHLRPLAGHPQPSVRRGQGAHREDRRGRHGLARPARGRRAPRRLHRDGPDRRERRPAARPRAARSSTSSASARRTSPRRPSPTASGPARSRRSPRPTAPWSARTTAPAPASPTRRSPQLDPVFRPDGVVTAGNCCALNDGAAAVVIMSDTKAAELGLTPLARIVSTGVSGLSPEIMGLGPVEATQARAGHAEA